MSGSSLFKKTTSITRPAKRYYRFGDYMVRISVLLITLFTANTARAYDENSVLKPLLWGEVRAGMTTAEVRAIYPEGRVKVKWHGNEQTEVEDVAILEGCNAEVEIYHATGNVSSVTVKGRGSVKGTCSNKVFSALAAKYGQPLGQTNQGGSIFKMGRSTAIWNRNGITMTYTWKDGNGMGGSGLLTSSWELSYETTAIELGL